MWECSAQKAVINNRCGGVSHVVSDQFRGGAEQSNPDRANSVPPMGLEPILERV
jgi:hypothetical protein